MQVGKVEGGERDAKTVAPLSEDAPTVSEEHCASERDGRRLDERTLSDEKLAQRHRWTGLKLGYLAMPRDPELDRDRGIVCAQLPHGEDLLDSFIPEAAGDAVPDIMAATLELRSATVCGTCTPNIRSYNAWIEWCYTMLHTAGFDRVDLSLTVVVPKRCSARKATKLERRPTQVQLKLTETRLRRSPMMAVFTAHTRRQRRHLGRLVTCLQRHIPVFYAVS